MFHECAVLFIFIAFYSRCWRTQNISLVKSRLSVNPNVGHQILRTYFLIRVVGKNLVIFCRIKSYCLIIECYLLNDKLSYPVYKWREFDTRELIREHYSYYFKVAIVRRFWKSFSVWILLKHMWPTMNVVLLLFSNLYVYA